MSGSNTTSSAGQKAEQWQSTLGRVGLTARGVFYGVLGIVALQFAFGSSSSSVSKGGVFSVVEQVGGTWMLALLTAGLFALALWELVRAATGDPVAGSETTDRVLYAVKGVVYGGTAVTALTTLLGGSSGGGGGSSGSGGGDSQSQAAGLLFGLPGGRFLVGLIGIGLIAYSAKQVKDHVLEQEFMSRLSTGEMATSTREAVEKAGRAGYGGRGVVVAIIGLFLVIAAVQHDPEEARGLGGSLVTLSQQSWGPIALVVVAAGLVAFGAFNIAEAKYRRDH